MRVRAWIALLGAVVLLCVACEDTTKLREMETLMKAENWEDAITRGKLFLQGNPETKRAKQVHENLAKCYYEWARVMDRKRRHAEGVKLLEIVVTEYRDTPYYADAMREIPRFHVEAGRKYYAQGDIIAAAKSFQTVLEKFRASPMANDARTELTRIGLITFNLGDDLWVMNADGSNPHLLVENAVDGDVAVLRSRVAFIRPKSPGSDSGTLHVLDLDGGEPTQLLRAPIARRPVLSADGRYIAVSKGSAFQIVSADASQKQTHRGFTALDTFGGWTPDNGRLLGYQARPRRGGNILMIDTEFEVYEILTNAESRIRDAVLSPTGRDIFYLTEAGLHVVAPGSSEQKLILSTEETGISFYSLDVSPDGMHLVFIGRAGEDQTPGFYRLSRKEELAIKPLEVALPEGKASNIKRRISWGQGYLAP
jgi:hypothetical protein